MTDCNKEGKRTSEDLKVVGVDEDDYDGEGLYVFWKCLLIFCLFMGFIFAEIFGPVYDLYLYVKNKLLNSRSKA